MTPFTELLEHMARRLPEENGACINSESELEAIGHAWGAAAKGEGRKTRCRPAGDPDPSTPSGGRTQVSASGAKATITRAVPITLMGSR